MTSLELFLTRNVKDPQLIEQCKATLDEWSDRIPFSPIKDFGSKTEFVSAVEYATYKAKVTTQIEKRWLEDHEVPYNEQQLPTSPLPKSSIDPWKVSFTPFADFSKHHRAQEMLETRCVYDCSTCRATGEVTCNDCSGSGQVNCRDCDGYGYNKCSSCSGRGQMRETRTLSRQVECPSCTRGRTVLYNEICDRCHGRGTELKEYQEEYFVPCGNCASSGKITCSTCRGHGKVTCGRCDGSGKVTCGRCDGQRRLLYYTTVEVEEDVSNNENQYVSPSLPKFKKNANPLSKLDGPTVFTQDETKRIEQFEFQSQPAAAVLSHEVDLCRVNHAGHILRQRIEIETCVLVEYCYRHSSNEYSIYINPEHKLVEDLDGPVQAFIENTDALAEKAFKEKRLEDAYRLITRGLCMDEATEAEKKLRDQILQTLLASYRKIALASWSCAAIVWCLASGLPSNFQISWWFVLGLIPLLLGIQLFAEDFGVRFSGPKDRTVPAVLIGIAAFLSGVVIGAGTSWTDWIGLASLTAVAAAIGLFRSNVRAKLQRLEAFFSTFPNPQALETYVLKFDPKPELSSRIKLVLVALVVLLAVQPMVKLASGIITASSGPTAVSATPVVTSMATPGTGPPGEQLQFRQIPAGTFMMGCTTSDSECDPDESPPHRVTLGKAFMMAQTETTIGQYGRCVAEGACSPPTPSTDYNDPGKSGHPVVNVTWGDATKFCRWAGARLPTEAEWEYAARGGRTESRYPWGASISHDNANYKETGGRDQWSGTSPVGSFEPNGYGLYDMSGNAWEWVADWYGEYPQSDIRNPSGPSSGDRRVLRGGSWSGVPKWLRVSYRVRGAPGYRFGSDGFRCARNVEGHSEVSSLNAPSSRADNAPAVTIGEFSNIPDEFAVGAGCSYSTTRNGKPVFIEDMGGDAVMVLNGKTVRLKWVQQTQATGGGVTNIYASSNFEISKSTTSIKTGHESASEEGYITVKSKDGSAVVKKRLYGLCGA